MITPIAELRFRNGRKPVTLQLTQTLTWTCDDPEIEQLMVEACPVETWPHSGRGPVLHNVYQAAARMGAEVRVSMDALGRLTS